MKISDIIMNPGIYLIRNKINGKCYVGQTQSLRKRLRSHYHIYKKGGNGRMILYEAILKYGKENFEILILATLKVYNKKALDYLEKKYIKEYNYYKHGYNQTEGGDGGILGYKMTNSQKKIISKGAKAVAMDGRYKLYCYNINTKEVIEYLNCTEAGNALGINPDTVSGALCHKRFCNSTYIFYTNQNTFAEILDRINSVKTKN